MSDLLPVVTEWVPWMQGRADQLDREAAFQDEEFDLLHEIGALSAPQPVGDLASLLVLVGQSNLSVGRLLEAHVNALHLIARYGTPEPWHATCLFGLWVAERPERR